MDSVQTAPAVLELRNVVKSFGTTKAVDDISLSVYRGETVALLGPNGAGKTSTIDMCEGFSRPDSGSIRVLGMDPAREPVRERLGIMLQEGGSYGGITVSEAIHLAASYSVNPLPPEWLLEILGLTSHRRTSYRRLSGGQKQRLSLALALIGRPELVFLDEPTAGLDAQSRLKVWDLISALHRDGVSVVLTTHLMDEAESLADRVFIIDRGKLVAAGSPAELTAVQSGLTLSTNATLDFPGLVAIRPRRYRMEASPTPELIAAVTQAAASQGVLITSFDTAHHNLEEVFLQLTGRDLR